ncbi:MAG: response regulator [Thermodesulfovibrionales bacterium]|nr:response regulator [Thermodesulfovibrionales bacterium]
MPKILVVDDNEKNLKLFRLIISSMGFETLTATDGQEGVRLAKEKLPDLILMDIQMPKMDGYAALNALRSGENTKAIPAIALTAYAMRGDRERLLEYGFTDYISKPIEKEGFIKTIREALKLDREGA